MLSNGNRFTNLISCSLHGGKLLHGTDGEFIILFLLFSLYIFLRTYSYIQVGLMQIYDHGVNSNRLNADIL